MVNVDNQGAIALAKNPVFHNRSKHIDIQYHYTKGMEEGNVGWSPPLTTELPCAGSLFDHLTFFATSPIDLPSSFLASSIRVLITFSSVRWSSW